MVNMSERTSNAARFLTHVCRLDTNGVKEPAHSDCGSLVIMEKEGSVCLILQYVTMWFGRHDAFVVVQMLLLQSVCSTHRYV